MAVKTVNIMVFFNMILFLCRLWKSCPNFSSYLVL